MSSSKLATRIISHPETTEFIRQDVWSPFNQPREDAGETLVAEILTDMGIEWWYEPFFYPLAFNDEGSVSFGFRPDFWLPLDPATGQLSKRVTASVSGCTVPMGSFEEEVVRNRRGIHIEVTRGKSGSRWLSKKHRKIDASHLLYGVTTALVTKGVWGQAMARPQILHQLISETLRLSQVAA